MEKIAGEKEIIKRVIEKYPDDPFFVAKVCDEILDRSGRLLGYVREKANKPLTTKEN